MELSEALRTRRSIRNFDPEHQVSAEELQRLFDMVVQTPSGNNLQPWEFLVVRDRQRKQKLQSLSLNQRHVGEAAAVIIALASRPLLAYLDEIREMMVTAGQLSQSQADDLAADLRGRGHGPEALAWRAKRDVCLACMTLMLAARELGYDTCPVGAFDAEAVRREWNLPDNLEPVLLLPLGKLVGPRPEAPARRPPDRFVHLDILGDMLGQP